MSQDILRALDGHRLNTTELHAKIPFWEKRDLILELRRLKEEGVIIKDKDRWVVSGIKDRSPLFESNMEDWQGGVSALPAGNKPDSNPDNADQALAEAYVEVANYVDQHSLPPELEAYLDNLEQQLKHRDRYVITDLAIKVAALDRLAAIMDGSELGDLLQNIADDLQQISSQN